MGRRSRVSEAPLLAVEYEAHVPQLRDLVVRIRRALRVRQAIGETQEAGEAWGRRISRRTSIEQYD